MPVSTLSNSSSTQLLFASANSAAIALAEEIGGTESKFADMMKAQLKDWGITDAKIVNASGLNNSYLGNNIYPGSKSDEENTMSAKGVAVIAQHVIKEYPEILDITKKTEANFDGVNKLKTFNYMLKGQPSYRKGVDGLQTGTTDLAGASFVAHSNESGMSIITVIINAEHTDTDDYAWFTATNELLNYVVYHWESKTIAKKRQAISKSQVDVLDGKSKQVSAVAKSDFNIIQKIDANNNKHIKVTTNQIQSPVKSGDKVGTATFEDRTLVGDGYLPNQGMPSMELVAGKEVKKSFFLKVWWNHFVTFVKHTDNLCIFGRICTDIQHIFCFHDFIGLQSSVARLFLLRLLYGKVDSILTLIDTKRQIMGIICLWCLIFTLL